MVMGLIIRMRMVGVLYSFPFSLSSKWDMTMAKLSVTLSHVDPQIPTNGSGPPKLQFKVSVFYFNSSKLPFVLYLEGHNSHRQVFTF